MRLPNFAKFQFFKRYIGIIITVLSLYFILNIFISSRTKIIPVLASINYLPFSCGIILICGFFLIRGYVWTKILKNLNYDIDKSESIYLLSVAELKRYIPGSITAIISRMHAYKKYKIPKKTVFKAYLIECVLFALTTTLISISSIIFILQRIYIPEQVYLVSFILCMLILLSGIYVLSKKADFIKNIHKYFDHFLILLFAWFVFGLGNFLVLISIVSVYPFIFVPLVSLFVLSWLVGFIVVVAPSGIGVREAVLIFGLALILPLDTAVLVAVLTRISLVMGDVIALFFVFLFNKLKRKFKFLIKISYAPFVVGSFTISYILYFSYVTFGKYLNFYTGRFDLGNMDQTVWNTLHGRIFLLTDPNGTGIISRLSIHADFMLILLSPFYLLWKDPRMLLLIQSVVLGMGGIFTYLLAKKITKNIFFSTALSISFLLNPLVQRQNLYDFHAVTLATTFLVAAFYFLENKKMFVFFVFLFLSIITKEDVLLISALFGFYIFLKFKKRAALFMGAVSLITFYILIAKIIPWYRGSAHFALSYFQEFGDSPLTIITTILLSPQKVFIDAVSFTNISYLFNVFVTTGFLSFLSPFYLIFAIPDLAINTLSSNGNLKSILFQYNATIIPFIYVATAFSAKNLSKIKWVNYRLIGLYVIIFALISTYFYGVLPGTSHPSLEIFSDPNPDSAEVASVLRKIPEDAKVAATNNLGSQLSHRQFIYTIPMGVNDADYLAFLFDDPFAQPSPQEQKKMVHNLLLQNKYLQIYNKDEFVILKKK